GVLVACARVNGPIAKLLVGKDCRRQAEIDDLMIKGDGTAQKSRWGANAILGVSLAVARAAAVTLRLPLYSYFRHAFPALRSRDYRLPLAFMNFVNGGRHADTDLDVQEIMIVPVGNRQFHERVRLGTEIFHALGLLLKKHRLDTDLGDEGGYAPRWGGTERALDLVMQAIRQARCRPAKDVKIGLDVAASELYDLKKKRYHWKGDRRSFSADQLGKRYLRWTQKYPLAFLEDPFAEEDWQAWQTFTKQAAAKKPPLWVMGDDLFVTNAKRLKKGISLGAANAIIIKPNQIGTLTETVEAIRLAQHHGYRVIVSHRSGETCDTTIADLAVASGADAIKTGSVARSERVAKYNRLMEIEEELRAPAKGIGEEE
ncbi:phosphopyruvate hydratase, partial [Candidatus Uhrbacteria bacterium]|nr:phosphopyruvate hydratase [Candidatus Uhrbacteria bacterium]